MKSPTSRWVPQGGQDLAKITGTDTDEGHVSTLDTYQAIISENRDELGARIVSGWALVMRETFLGNVSIGDPDEAQRLAALAGIAEPERMVEGSEAPK